MGPRIDFQISCFNASLVASLVILRLFIIAYGVPSYWAFPWPGGGARPWPSGTWDEEGVPAVCVYLSTWPVKTIKPVRVVQSVRFLNIRVHYFFEIAID